MHYPYQPISDVYNYIARCEICVDNNSNSCRMVVIVDWNTMKISKEHYTVLKIAIESVYTPELHESYKTAGLSERRFCWDLLYRANCSTWICDNLYSYLDDTHIDTAIKKIFVDINSNSCRMVNMMKREAKHGKC